MSIEAVLDDEMEAMLREIEGIGMTPEVAKEPEPEIVKTIAAEKPETAAEAVESLKEMMTSDIEDIEDIEAAVAAIESATVVEEPKKVAKSAAKTVAKSSPEPAPEPVDDGPTPSDPENVVAAVKKSSEPVRVATAASDIIDADQVKRDIAINPADLDTDLIQHPSMQLHYALKTADARRAYERLKSGVEILEAKLDSGYRERLSDGVKKPTEAAIRNALVADPQYASAQAKLIDAQHVWKMCEAIESSFHSRKDILLEVARDRRKEKEGAMRVMEDTDLRSRVAGVMGKK